MKRILPGLIVCLLGIAAGAQTNFEVLHTASLDYSNATIIRTSPAYAVVMYNDGIAKVPWTNLPITLQKQFGYSPAAAAAFAIQEKQKHIAELQAKQEDLYLVASSLPNNTHPLTPIGSESHARVISTHGPPLLPKNPSRDHLNVAKELDMVDMESGVTVTGSSWYFLRNGGALLELALINYAVASAVKAGFTPVTTPDVVKADIANRCGFEPRDTLASQVYHIQKKGQGEQHVLAGTAEIPLAGMFARRVIPEKNLPIFVAGIGRAFRAEAGARGADTRALYRVHQFSKVELFAVTSEEQSDSMLDRLVDLQKLIFNGLNLPFRRVSPYNATATFIQ